MKSKCKIIFLLIKKYIKFNVLTVLVSLISIAITYLMPLLNVKIIDDGIQNNNVKVLFASAITLFIIGIINTVINYILSVIRLKYNYIIDRDMKNTIINYFLYSGKKNEKIDDESQLDTLIRNDIICFIRFVSDNVHSIFFACIKIIVLSIVLLRIQPILAVGIVATHFIYTFVLKHINKKLEKISMEIRCSYVNTIQKINEIIQHIQELWLLNGVNFMMKKYNSALEQSYKVTKKNNNYVQITIFVSLIFETLLQTIILGAGGYLIVKGHFTIGFLVSFMNYSAMYDEAIKEVLGVWTDYCEEKESLDIVFDIVEDIYIQSGELTYGNMNNMSAKIPMTIDKLSLRNVSFSYDESVNILSGANASFDNKQINYLIGKSGEGKSTLIKLLLGYLEPEKGSIYYGDKELKEILEKKQIADYVAWVPQEPVLFADTIRNNIMLGNDIDEKELIDVCKKCAFYDDISKFEDGLDTILGDNGEKLSVGQKHRLGMVRAFLQKKPILLIDEGSAGLDSYTEKVICDNMKELCKDRLTIIVTHSEQFIVENANVYELSAGKLR